MRHGRARRWRTVVLAPVGDGSTRRRASDAVRVGTAVLVVALSVGAIRHPLSFESTVVEAVSPLPSGLHWIVSSLWFIGSIGAMVASIAIVLLVGRVRLATEMAVVGLGTWAVCALLTAAWGTDGGRPDPSAYPGFDLGFPLARIAVATALVATIVPYLSRPFRRFVLALVVLAAVAAVLRGAGLPVVVVASLAIGWGLAAVLRLAVGSPTGLPSVGEVVDAAAALGLALADVSPVRPQVWGVARFTAMLDGRPVDVSIYGRDAADAQLLAKVWRFLWYRDSGPTLSLTRLQQVEHEAYLDLAAARAGLTAPDVVLAAMAPSGQDALLVTRPPAGSALAELDADEVTDQVLDAVLAEAGRLRTAGIAHGDLSATSIVVDRAGTRPPVVGLREFRTATSSAPNERIDRDLGGLLIVLALRAGSQRTIDATVRVLGTDALEAALPQIQASAVDRATRHAIRHQKQLLGELREAGATAAGVESPKLAEIHRVSLSGLAMGVGALVGLVLIVREVAGVGGILATLKTAQWQWVVLCFIAAQATNVTQAWSVMGSVSSALPFGPTLGLELANAFTGLVGGTLGTTATIIRYFQRRGLAVSVAVSSGVLVSAAGMVSQAVLFVTAFLLTRGDFDFGTNGTTGSSNSGGHNGTLLLLGIVLVAVAVGLITAVPRFRKVAVAKLQPQVTAARENLRELATQPGKLVKLFGGAAGAQILFAVALGFALKAYGSSLSLPELIVINTIASLLGGVAPVPGGMGVIEAGLIAGMTAAGVPDTVAVAATITQRLFTCYLPPIWGYPTLAWMRKREYL
ncbi:MAG: lysylphosphatidylglycerol synthase domain-containing protein [Acidimicrobiales bacterium]